MHKYEEMFLNNKKELEKLIEDLTNKSLNNNTDDEVKQNLQKSASMLTMKWTYRQHSSNTLQLFHWNCKFLKCRSIQ